MGSDVHDDDTTRERPKVFGDYYLLTTLARGGMGTVHLAKRLGFRPDIQRFCVVKKLRRGHANPGWLRRFQDEARVVVTLNHRALCHVFDVGVVNDEHYLAMELIEGVTLQKVMALESGLAPGLALYVLDEVLDALEYAHGHRDPATGAPLLIVHRDVSPHNVMLSFQGGVKLIDFGLVSSTLKSEHTVGGVVVGKLEYMSPEQARGEGLDARTDVYAAAVILYELLSGRRFYGELTKNAIMMELVEGTYAPAFAGVPPALVPALSRALAPDRAVRTSSCAAFQAELSAAGGQRASSRELRDALELALPGEKSRLEALVRGFRDVGIETPPHDAHTQITHIARSDELLASEPSVTPVDVEQTRTLALAMRAPAAPVLPPERSTMLALAVATLSGAAIIAVWLLVRSGPSSDPVATPLVQVDPVEVIRTAEPVPPRSNADAPWAVRDGGPNGATVIDAAVAEAAAEAHLEVVDAGVAEAAPADVAEVADPAEVADAEDLEIAEGEGERSAKRPVRKPRRAKPPNAPLPDLAAHLDYLARWCARVPCARPVLSARGRIPLLDVVGLRALRRDAEACVVECRR